MAASRSTARLNLLQFVAGLLWVVPDHRNQLSFSRKLTVRVFFQTLPKWLHLPLTYTHVRLTELVILAPGSKRRSWLTYDPLSQIWVSDMFDVVHWEATSCRQSGSRARSQAQSKRRFRAFGPLQVGVWMFLTPALSFENPKRTQSWAPSSPVYWEPGHG